MLKPAFVDLSHHNVIPDDLRPAASIISGVVHKATEGTSFTDDKLKARRYLAQDAGLLWGVYQFIRPGSVEAQVDYFLNAIRDVSDDETMLALDWEDSGVSLSQAIEFMQRIEQETGRSPVLYSGHVLKDALGGKPNEAISCYRLWLAQYADSPTLPPGYDSCWAWQYTDQGEIPGIDPPTDLNAYDGTPEQLAAEWSGAEVEPIPPVEAEILVIVPPGISVKVINRKN